MKRALFLYTGSDRPKAEPLKDHLQAKLHWMVEIRSIKDVLAEEQNLQNELPRSDCVVLIGSRQASSLIHNKRSEIDDGFETFDGKLFHKEFTDNQDLLKRLIIVFFTEKDENDFIPADFDKRRIFDLTREKIREGNPALDHLLYWMKQILFEDE